MEKKLTEYIIKRSLLKAILITLIFQAFNFLVGPIIILLQVEPYTNILFVTIHAFCLTVSVIIGIMIIRKFKWNFSEIGIRCIQKNSLKNVFYLIPIFIIEMLPLFTGFRDNGTNVNTIKILFLLVLHFFVVSIHEEFYFRGIILSLFRNNIKKAILVSSIIFSAGHFTNIVHVFWGNSEFAFNFISSLMLQIINAFIFGVVYAEIVVITKSLLPVIFFHTLGNFAVNISKESSIIIGAIQWSILIVYAIVMWNRINRTSPDFT